MTKPTNLRSASPASKHKCANCAYYEGHKCAMFNDYPVTGGQVCDEWTNTR